jgi:hypothetical protein
MNLVKFEIGIYKHKHGDILKVVAVLKNVALVQYLFTTGLYWDFIGIDPNEKFKYPLYYNSESWEKIC